jgi:NAD(P)-binding Rossmann-like domain
MNNLESDYLIVGSGAVGMAVADVLFHETDARLTIVDRHHGPGGHWNDAYPFVRLHQPSAYYGVNSRELGSEARDMTRLNLGMCDRATGAQLLSYYEALMQTFLASGRVDYFPMSEYVGDYTTDHAFKSVLSGDLKSFKVRKKIVDTSYLNTAVPSTHPPKYAIAPGLTCVPLNELPRQKKVPSGYVVVGAGKTGIDATLWLLDNGVAPKDICWIMPRDSWFQDRANVQPGEEFFTQSYGSFATQMEVLAEAASLDELFVELEANGQLLRFDVHVQPTMYHGAVVSKAELTELRQIKNIVRLGRVQRIEADRIVLANGTVPADPHRHYVDCSASAVERRPGVPIFEGKKITPQMVRTFQPTFSGALIAHIEAQYGGSLSDAEINELCAVIPMPDQPFHWLTMLAVNMANQRRWSKNAELRQWIANSRLDAFTAMANRVKPEETDKLALLQRLEEVPVLQPPSCISFWLEAPLHRG